MKTIQIVSAILLIGVQLITPIIGQGQFQQFNPYGQSQGTQSSTTAVATTVQSNQPGFYGQNYQTNQPFISGPSPFTQSYYPLGYNGPCQSDCVLGNIIYQIALLAQGCGYPSYQQPISYPQGFQQGVTSASIASGQYAPSIDYPQAVTSASFASAQQYASPISQPQSPQYIQGPVSPYGPPPTAYQTPYQQTPYQQTPYQQTPYQQTPYQQTPYQQTPYQQTPYQQTPYQQTPYQQTPYQQTPYQQTPYQQTPYQQTPYQQTPYQQTSYQQTSYQPTPYSQSQADSFGFSYGNADSNNGGSAGSFAASDAQSFTDITNPDGSETISHDKSFSLASSSSQSTGPSASAFSLTGSHSYTETDPAN